jgi:hypothetical protein
MSGTATLLAAFGLSGGESIRIYDVKPASNNENVTISDVESVKVIGAVVTNAIATTATALIMASENASTANQVDYKLYSAAATFSVAYLPFRLILKVVS